MISKTTKEKLLEQNEKLGGDARVEELLNGANSAEGIEPLRSRYDMSTDPCF